VRDAQSIIDCFDQLTQSLAHEPAGDALAPLRERLVQRRRRIADSQLNLSERLAELQERLQEVRQRIDAWQLSDDGFSAIEPGLHKTYGRARRILKRLRKATDADNGTVGECTDADWHDLRKRVKYHWYHMRLLRRVWPEMVQVRRQAAKKLGVVLGDDHDLSVLRDRLSTETAVFGSGEDVQFCLALIEQRRKQLHDKVLPAAKRLFAEKPRRFTNLFRRYWRAWKGTR
jgi:CHAD domain-containing protein